MPVPPSIHLHIEKIVIDEAVHRAGPDAVRMAVAAQLPALLRAHAPGLKDLRQVAQQTANNITRRAGASPPPSAAS